jgi:hypothetical protein
VKFFLDIGIIEFLLISNVHISNNTGFSFKK